MRVRSHIVPPPDCTGCALCANSCPQDAISIVWSAEGFLIPSVEESRCIACGLCADGCPALHPPHIQLVGVEETESYGAWNRDEELHHDSSSGGVFSALARYIFARGGCVFGVAWKDKASACFCKAENMEQLAAMRGSKYTPAMPGYVYRELRAELKAGRYVLFCGTPCQVQALKRFLKGQDERLVTMDVVCHGVPSRHLMQKYIEEDESAGGRELARISFRDKGESWIHYSVTRHYADGTQNSTPLEADAYMRMFLSDTALNIACYACPCARLPRVGDFSAGDYWGVEARHPDWPVRWGVSSLLVNSRKGKRMVQELPQYGLELRPEPFRSIYGGHELMYTRQGRKVHPNRPFVMKRLCDVQSSLQEALREATEYSFFAGMRLRREALPWRLMRLLKRCARALLRW